MAAQSLCLEDVVLVLGVDWDSDRPNLESYLMGKVMVGADPRTV